MDEFTTTSHKFRKARARGLIQLAGLMEKAGLLDTFGIKLGADMQRDMDMKFPVASLYKGLVVLNEMAQSDQVHLQTWGHQGSQLLGELNRKND